MQPTDALYYKYAGVIDSVVKKYAYVCPDIEDDLYLQAQLIFCEACISYDPNHPNHASFETWLRRQLQMLTKLIHKASTGPTHVKIGSQSCIPVCRVYESTVQDTECDFEISGLAANQFVEDYGESLNASAESDFPTEMQPYIKALKGDSLRIFQDFCNGKFDLGSRKFITREKQKDRTHLNPMRLYRRVYIHEGWTLDRVTEAWRSVCGIFANYRKGALPVMVCSQKYMNIPVVRTHLQASKGKWKDSFLERHGISYSRYRTLRKRGLVPKVGMSSPNLDLSKFATA